MAFKYKASDKVEKTSLVKRLERHSQHFFDYLAALSRKQISYLLTCCVLAISLTMALPARAAISFRSMDSASTGNGTSIAVPKPAGLTVGDVMIAAFGVQMGYPSQDPSGWTRILSTVDTNKNIGQTMYYKVATSSDVSATSFTFSVLTATRLTGVISAYAGVDTASPIGASAGQFGNSATLTAPAVGVTVDNSWVVSAYSHDYGSTVTGYGPLTQRYELITSGGGSAGSKMMSMGGDKLQATAGTASSSSITVQNSDFYIGQSIVLKPFIPTSFTQSAYRWFDNSDSSGEITFAKSTGGSAYDNAYTVAKTSDGGYIATGYTTSFGSGSFDLSLSKYDAVGTLMWSRTWGGTGNESGYGVVQTSDGGYIVTGYSTSYGGGGEDMILLKYSSTGTLSWSRTWGSTGADNGRSVITTSDGGFAVTGYTDSYGSGSADMFLAKYTSAGSLSWSRTWGGASADVGYALIQTSDGGYAITGYNVSYGAGNRDMYLAKYDSTGTLSWSRTLGGTGIDYGQGLVQTTDGGFALTGQTDSFGGGGSDMLLAKYTSTGSLSWARTWGGASNDSGYSLINTGDGGFAVSGYTISYGSGNEDMFLAKYDSAGSHSWSRTIGGTGFESSYRIIPESSGGYALAGYTDSYGSGSADLFMARYDSTGSIANCSATICRTPTPGTASPSPTATSPSAGTASPSAATSTPSPATSTPAPGQSVVVAAAPSVGVGSATAAQNTAASATNENIVRLRLTVDVTAQVDPGSVSFKLQYVAKGSGTCAAPSGGLPSSYTDVTSSTLIAYADNPVAMDGQTVAANANDPVHSGHTNVYQAYQEANDAAVSAVILSGQDGLWDFALKDNNAKPSTSYCFRMVKSDGSVLNTYTTYPELTTSEAQYEQSGYRVFENAPISSGSSTFAAAYGVYGYNDSDTDVFQTSDGGYITGGTASSGGISDGRLVKYSQGGSVQWSRRISYGETVNVRSITELSNGDIVAVGRSVYDANDQGAYRSFIGKFSSNGSLVWLRHGARDAFEYDVVESADGSIATIGYTSGTGTAGSDDAVITNFSATDGTVNWSRYLGGTASDRGTDISVLNNGSYVIGGTTQSYASGSYEGFIAEYNSSGTFQWMKTLGQSSSTDEVKDIASAPDGGFAVMTTVGGAANISKHDASGTLEWSYTLSTSGDFDGIAVTNSGDVVASGHYGLSSETRLGRFSSDGTLVQLSAFYDSGIVFTTHEVASTTDGGFIVVGSANGYYPENKALLLKYDSNGEIANCENNCMELTPSSNGGVSAVDQSPASAAGSVTSSTATYSVASPTEDAIVIVSYATQGAAAIEPGAALAATNTPATLLSTGAAFRVRTLVHMTNKGIPSDIAFKLQYAAKNGSCSGTSGFSDVTGTSVIAFHDNAGGATGSSLGPIAADPSHSGHSMIYNAYVESNPFNSMATIGLGQDGLWEFSLKDNGAPASTAYCLRMVRENGSAFESYTQFAEVTTYGTGGGETVPALNQMLRGGQSVIDGIKRGFLW